ncbi:PREDICTED: transmembrane protein 35B-like isoform X2 [Branchiostoma belcheri]|uniref:Transmembrane protein 35B-like isoform X2 n=1 Tax=Branchiostoma belcheri TaxID=7741 RepID=A0A6P4ZLN9_BRABE|nr:PREDICTED: transmembrane protein 35B-like isoform X2 [Branchiostoma belcheri]
MAEYISGGLGLFYVAAGAVKLFPFIPVQAKLKDDFVKFATVFPLKPLGIVPNPTLYMYAVGVIEFGAGVMLGLGSHEQQVTSAMVLFGIMVGGLYTLVSLGRKQTDWIPPIVCMALLGLYLFQTL